MAFNTQSNNQGGGGDGEGGEVEVESKVEREMRESCVMGGERERACFFSSFYEE